MNIRGLKRNPEKCEAVFRRIARYNKKPEQIRDPRFASFALAVTAVAFLALSAAHAASSDWLASAVGDCSAQPDRQARLACYDRIAAQLKATLAQTPVPVPSPRAPAAQEAAPAVAPAPPPPAPVTAAPAPVAQATPPKEEESAWYDVGSWFGGSSEETPPATVGTPAGFGSERLPPAPRVAGTPPPPEPLDHITANVVRVFFNGFGKFTVELDNGQTWQQLDSDSGTARFVKNRKNTVTISRGLLDSYDLVVEDHNALFKVRRIK